MRPVLVLLVVAGAVCHATKGLGLGSAFIFYHRSCIKYKQASSMSVGIAQQSVASARQHDIIQSISTMVRFLPSLGVAAALVASVADARTTVAVLEVGQGGVVRRTAAASPHATVTGVASFWSAVHDEVAGRIRRGSRAAQHPGMAVVPDLFSRADGGLALGVTSVPPST